VTSPDTAGTDTPVSSDETDFTEFAEGDVEPTLRKTIRHLIAKNRGYIVYLDEDLYVEWASNIDIDMIDGRDTVLNKVSMLEAIPVTFVGEDVKLAFRRMVAEGVARLFDPSSSSASAMSALERAESWIQARNDEVARTWYLTASAIAGGVVTLLCIALWLMRQQAREYLSIGAFDVLFGATLGGIGALLSVIQRSRALGLEPAAGKRLHYMEGVARIIVGGLGAMLLGLAFKGDLLLGFAAKSPDAPVLLAVICFVAGASERLVPSFIEKIDISQTNNTHDLESRP